LRKRFFAAGFDKPSADNVLAAEARAQSIAVSSEFPTIDAVAHWFANLPYDAVVLERNKGWVSRVRTMLGAEKPSMMVVGFYHMVGPDRMQLQLAQAGFAVERIWDGVAAMLADAPFGVRSTIPPPATP
jgi:hypothetical protein